MSSKENPVHRKNDVIVSINILELASELATLELEAIFKGCVYDEPSDYSRFSEEAQDVFNELYDKYFSIIINCREDN